MFCPYCANLLVVEPASQGMRFACKTCPYEHKILKKIKKTTPLEQKKVTEGCEALRVNEMTAICRWTMFSATRLQTLP